MRRPHSHPAAPIIAKLSAMKGQACLENRAGTNARLINAVHDELLLEAPQDQADQMALTVAREMERAMAVVVPQVPPKADVRVGTHWSK